MTVYVYQILNVVRGLWKHGRKLVNAEDILYWLGISGYLFYQMYQTTYGIIRWYFILGVVAGAICADQMVRKCRKWGARRMQNRKEKAGKKVEK